MQAHWKNGLISAGQESVHPARLCLPGICHRWFGSRCAGSTLLRQKRPGAFHCPVLLQKFWPLQWVTQPDSNHTCNTLVFTVLLLVCSGICPQTPDNLFFCCRDHYTSQTCIFLLLVFKTEEHFRSCTLSEWLSVCACIHNKWWPFLHFVDHWQKNIKHILCLKKEKEKILEHIGKKIVLDIHECRCI